MNERIESALYNQAFKMNAMSILTYKSSRKNALSSPIINVNHLSSPDVIISDERILEQFVGTLDSIVSHSIRFNGHLELTAYVGVFKKASYINADNNLYCTTSDTNYCFKRECFYSLEKCINFLFDMYCMIYPYNEIHRNTIFNNPSVKYIMRQYREEV